MIRERTSIALIIVIFIMLIALGIKLFISTFSEVIEDKVCYSVTSV